MRSYLTLFVLSLALGACRHLPIDPYPDPPPSDPPGNDSSSRAIVFDLVQENHAWGYQYHGFYVDAGGDLYSYQWSQGMARPAEQRDKLTADELAALHAYAPTFVRHIGGDTVSRMKALVADAANGPYSDTTMYGADMGAAEYVAYRLDAASKRYMKVGMRLRGDNRYDNLSGAGQTIADWLEQLR